MIAAVKVITFSVPEPIVVQAEAILQAGPALVSIRTFAPKAAGLVLTRMPRIKSNQRYLKFQLLRAATSSFCVGYPRMALIPPRL